MKNLHQSLIDYDMALLKAIAECRSVSLTTASKSQAIQTLSMALLSPTQTAIIVADLAPAELEALQFLLENGGQVEAPRFARHYGPVRAMGAARLAREQPWQKPASPAEGLWYRGLIFKTFHLTAQGNKEFVYIPTDLLPFLNEAVTHQTGSNLLPEQARNISTLSRSHPAGPRLKPFKALRPKLVSSPVHAVNGESRLRESMFSLLAFLQMTPVKPQPNGQLSPKDIKTLLDCLPTALLATFPIGVELDFLLHLGQRAGLLVIKHGRLRPDRDPTRTWLQASETEQVQLLRTAWRADPTWNDLWHVPGLVIQPTGWENSPLLARSKILGFLDAMEVGPTEWVSIADFVANVKQLDPDFQRPDGDYDSWYIYDTAGSHLMGFEHWDQVEGALLRYFITNLLLLLGVTEVGLASQTGDPVCFRLTEQGLAFLNNQPGPAPAKQTPYLQVGTNFQVRVPAQANLYDRFQLARFAKLDRREENRVVYEISQASVGRALRNGITADQMVAFLARATNSQTPLKVVETLRTWGKRQGAANLERVILLRLRHESFGQELRQHPTLGPLLGESIGPTTFLVPSENSQEVRRILTDLGYLTDRD